MCWQQNNILSDIGNVYCCGCNNNHRCGFDEPDKIIKPKLLPIKNKEKLIKVAVGALHTIMMDNRNQVHYFGFNNYGQFGTNNDNDIKQSFLPSIHSYFNDNNIKIIDIDCQTGASLFIDDKNNGYMCGINRYGMYI